VSTFGPICAGRFSVQGHVTTEDGVTTSGAWGVSPLERGRP
jgi:hypothetical protein